MALEDVIIRQEAKPKLRSPIFIEGLPGVGNVGKLASEHLIDELGGVRFAQIYSKYFPPQVFVLDDGTVRLVSNDLFYVKTGPKHKNDLILMTGDYQGLSPEGQYELTDRILKFIKGLGVKRMYTLGGYSLGKNVDEPRVLGAATSVKLVKEMKKHKIVFPKGEPGNGIVGASGLFLGLGMIEEMEGVCLMGETSGYFVDPRGAEAVLRSLSSILKIKIGFDKLHDKAAQIDQITSRLKDMDYQYTPEPKNEDINYIG